MKTKRRSGLLFCYSVILLFCFFAFMACRNGGEDGNTEPKTIIITGLPGEYDGKVAVLRLDSTVNADPLGGIAFGQWEIAGSPTEMSLPLKTEPELTNDWTGTGAYYVLLKIGPTAEDESPDIHFCYTNGATPNAELTDIPKYDIRETITRIPFRRFYDITSMMEQ